MKKCLTVTLAIATALCLLLTACAKQSPVSEKPQSKPASVSPVRYKSFAEIGALAPNMALWELEGQFYFTAIIGENAGVKQQPLFQYDPADGSCTRISEADTIISSLYNGRFYYHKYSEALAQATEYADSDIGEEAVAPAVYSNSPAWDDERVEEEDIGEFLTITGISAGEGGTMYRGVTADTNRPYSAKLVLPIEGERHLLITMEGQEYTIPVDTSAAADSIGGDSVSVALVGITGGRVYYAATYWSDNGSFSYHDIFSVGLDGSGLRRLTRAEHQGNVVIAHMRPSGAELPTLRADALYYVTAPYSGTGEPLSDLYRYDLASDNAMKLCTIEGTVNMIAFNEEYLVYHLTVGETFSLVSRTWEEIGQIKDMSVLLSEQEINGLVGSLHLYAAPEEVSLQLALYDGASTRVFEKGFTESEQQAIKTSPYYNEFMQVYAFKKEDIEGYVQKWLGLSLSELTTGTTGLAYIEEYDLYFLQHTDTNLFSVSVTDIRTDQSGNYVVRYVEPYFGAYVVTLRKLDRGWQFISNVKVVENVIGTFTVNDELSLQYETAYDEGYPRHLTQLTLTDTASDVAR